MIFSHLGNFTPKGSKSEKIHKNRKNVLFLLGFCSKNRNWELHHVCKNHDSLPSGMLLKLTNSYYQEWI